MKTLKQSRIKVGERVVWTWAGPHFGKQALVEHVRKDGLLILHFDGTPAGDIQMCQPYEVARVK